MRTPWTITAFAFAITIATYGPNEPSIGCTALSIPGNDIIPISVPEIANSITTVFQSGTSPEILANDIATLSNAVSDAVGVNLTSVQRELVSRLSGPLRNLSLTIVNIGRSILSNIENSYNQWTGFARETLDSIQASIGASRVINGKVAVTARHRRQLAPTNVNPLDDYINQVQSFIENLQEILTNFEKQIIDTPQLLEDVVSLLSTISAHPLKYVSNLLSTIGGLSFDSLQSFVKQSYQIFLKFLTTQLVPLVHRILNSIDKTQILPSTFHSFVSAFNTVYNLLKVLGYVN